MGIYSPITGERVSDTTEKAANPLGSFLEPVKLVIVTFVLKTGNVKIIMTYHLELNFKRASSAWLFMRELQR